MAAKDPIPPAYEQEENLDPYVLLRRQYKGFIARIEALEKQMANLQTTWNRLLSVSNEPYLQQPPKQPRFYGNPQQQYVPPPTQQQERAFAPWDEPILAEEDIEKPKPSKKKIILTILGFALILLILAVTFLNKQGWTCAFLPH